VTRITLQGSILKRLEARLPVVQFRKERYPRPQLTEFYQIRVVPIKLINNLFIDPPYIMKYGYHCTITVIIAPLRLSLHNYGYHCNITVIIAPLRLSLHHYGYHCTILSNVSFSILRRVISSTVCYQYHCYLYRVTKYDEPCATVVHER
jgi:hypothetical protein